MDSFKKKATDATPANDLQARKYDDSLPGQLCDLLPEIVAYIDKDLHCRFINVRFEELFHLAPADIVGRPIREIIGEAAYQKVELIYQAALAGDEQLVELPITLPDGNRRFIKAHYIPDVNNDEVIGFFSIIRDITAERLAEKRLVESERNYREIFDASSEAIIIHDAETGRIVDINQTMLDMYGYSREEALQLEVADISCTAPAFSQAEAVKKLQRAIDDGPQLFEWFARHKTGDCFWVEVALQSTAIGGQDRVLAVIRNISERKRLDSQIRLMQHWVEHNEDLFFWVQEDSRILYVNPAVCNALNYTLDELCDMQVGDFDLGLPHEAWPDFARKLKDMGTYRFESRLRGKDGRIFPVEITANHLQFESKDNFFAYARDISDRIRAEKDHKKLELQLAQAQKLEAIGTLAGGIAHDFNNILSSVIGFAELAKLDLPEHAAEPRAHMGQVIKAGLRAKELVQHILTFSRHTKTEKHRLHPAPVIKEVSKLLKSTLPASIEVRVNLEDPDLAVLGDPSQIHQILMNLCVNAVYAMTDDGGRLEIGLRKARVDRHESVKSEELAPGEYLELTVSDTGPGISNEILDWIFDPFFTTKPRGKGSGMGLSVVHGIVKAMDGTIVVESEPGSGTLFRVILPVQAVSREDPRAAGDKALRPGRGKILFVDDEKDLTLATGKLLRKLGYDVITAANGLAALDTFTAQANDFDLVITDLDMPGITGIELAKQIVAVRPEVPIILCTGFASEFTQESLDELGIRSLIRKPVIPSELSTVVNAVIAANQKVKSNYG